jgi:hypothetical protein
MVERISPPHAVIAWSTAASSPLSSSACGCEEDDIARLHLEQACSSFVLVKSTGQGGKRLKVFLMRRMGIIPGHKVAPVDLLARDTPEPTGLISECRPMLDH